MIRVPLTSARRRLGQLCTNPDRIMITSHGNDIACLVTPKEASLLASLDAAGVLHDMLSKLP